jgi:O-antigen/teichoic acid export membrane protein
VVHFLLLVLKSVRAPIPAPLGEFMVVAGCVLAAGIQQAVIGLFTQARNYAGIAAIRLSQGTLFSAMAMFPGIGLVAAHALSFLATVPSAARRFTRTPPSVNGLIDTAKDHRAFPLQSLPGAVLDVVAFSICIWTVTFAYGSHDAGQFSQVQRLIGAPLLLISMSMTQVLLRITADQVQHPLAMRRLFRQIGVGALLAGTALVCVVAIAGESALRWILGSGWTVDPGFILPIALAVTVRACVSPLSSILVTLRRFDVALLWQAAYFVCAATTLGLAAFHLEFRDFLVIYAIHEVVLYAAYAFLIHRCVEKKHVRHLRSD